jgi:glutamine cyclotransferase
VERAAPASDAPATAAPASAAPPTAGAAPTPTSTGASRVGTAEGAGATSEATTSQWRVELLETRPHDTTAFTQGLELADGVLYESTGQYGRSAVRELDPVTGQVHRQAPLAVTQFGEGLTVVGDRLVQLTWREGVALVWDRASLELVAEHPLEREGWGACYDAAGDRLVTSDGSATLVFRRADDLVPLSSVAVTADGAPIDQLNELECDAATGLVWANVWHRPEIVGIDPATGRVERRVDASALVPAGLPSEAVLNGIAALGDGTYLLTGKYWPTSHVVRFVPA